MKQTQQDLIKKNFQSRSLMQPQKNSEVALLEKSIEEQAAEIGLLKGRNEYLRQALVARKVDIDIL